MVRFQIFLIELFVKKTPKNKRCIWSIWFAGTEIVIWKKKLNSFMWNFWKEALSTFRFDSKKPTFLRLHRLLGINFLLILAFFSWMFLGFVNQAATLWRYIAMIHPLAKFNFKPWVLFLKFFFCFMSFFFPSKHFLSWKSKSIRSEVFCKKSVLWKFVKLPKKTLVFESLFQ